jgi:hypothetical protein
MMWPRYCEMLLGLWLMAAPWVLNYGSADAFRMTGVAAAAGIFLLDILSVKFTVRYSHLAIAGIALGLLIHAYFVLPGEAAGTQNNILVALLLLMFAILPTEATLSPPSWREFNGRRG